MLDVGDIAYIESGLWIAFYKKLVETNLKLLISMYLLVWIDVDYCGAHLYIYLMILLDLN